MLGEEEMEGGVTETVRSAGTKTRQAGAQERLEGKLRVYGDGH